MIGYKLVRMKNNRYFSLMNSRHSLEYFMGKSVRPRFGKLFVFSDLKYAVDFLSNFPRSQWNNPWTIIECEYTPSRENIGFVANCTDDYEKFWDRSIVTLDISPEGTVLADEVILKEMIQNESGPEVMIPLNGFQKCV